MRDTFSYFFKNVVRTNVYKQCKKKQYISWEEKCLEVIIHPHGDWIRTSKPKILLI